MMLASGALHELAYDYLPGYSRMRRHTRFVSVAGFGSILLAGYGLQHLWPRSTRRRVGAALLLALAVLLGTGQLPPTRRQLDDPAQHEAAIAAELAPVLADPALGRFHHQAHREQASWISLDVESTGGALGGPGSGNQRYHELLPEHTRPAVLERRVPHVLDVLNVRYMVSYAPLDFAHLEPLPEPDRASRERARLRELDLARVRLSRRTTARPRVAVVQRPTLVFGSPTQRREEVVSRLRRAQAGCAEVLVESTEADLDALEPAGFGAVLFPGLGRKSAALKRWASTHPDGELTFTAGTSAWTRPGETLLTPVEDARFEKDLRSIRVDVSGLGPGFLLLSEPAALYPGWSATLDGRRVELALADGLVTMIDLPAGASRLEVTYTPPGLRLGAWITGGTLVILALLALLAPRGRAAAPTA
jgi:hypothetical protein